MSFTEDGNGPIDGLDPRSPASAEDKLRGNDGPLAGGESGELEKDVFSRERTRLCIAKKGLNIFEVFKTNWLLSANERQWNPKRGQKATLCAALKSNSRRSDSA
jgi:hypothetical protein